MWHFPQISSFLINKPYIGKFSLLFFKQEVNERQFLQPIEGGELWLLWFGQ